MITIRLALLALTDSAVLVAAKEKGFAQEEGIALEFIRTTSWATVRDRLLYNQVDAAQMLAPLAVAVALGMSQQPAGISAPYKLNVNGNLLVMAPQFAAALEPDVRARLNDPLAAAHDFASATGLHRRKPVIGVVHRFSSHALMVRYWLASAGIDPDRDVELRVLPPSLMVEAMRNGDTDGFIAGEPWGSAAIAEGLAEAVVVGERIWRRGVEKVLAFRTTWMEQNPDTVDALLRALSKAGEWCDDPDNRPELARLLAGSSYIGRYEELILAGLQGRILAQIGTEPVDVPDLMLFHREATAFPWRSQALWIYSQLIRWKMIEPSAANEAKAMSVFRPDIYRRALAGTDALMPGASMKVEGALDVPVTVGAQRGGITLGPDQFFDGNQFDPERIDDYLAKFGPHP